MATNNTTTNNTVITLQSIIQQQQQQSIKQYVNYNSKQQLLSSKVLNTQQSTLITNLKNCFSFSLHNNKQYLIITMYFNNTKSYSYYVLNLTTLTVNIFTTIKLSKQFVQQQILLQQQSTTTTTTTKTK